MREINKMLEILYNIAASFLKPAVGSLKPAVLFVKSAESGLPAGYRALKFRT
jgi:hypothetical protein